MRGSRCSDQIQDCADPARPWGEKTTGHFILSGRRAGSSRNAARHGARSFGTRRRLSTVSRARVREVPRLCLLCHGFVRAGCDTRAEECLVAFSCKPRICPSCTSRRMTGTAADLVNHVFPTIPYWQWVWSLPRQVRFLLARDGTRLSLDGSGRVVVPFSCELPGLLGRPPKHLFCFTYANSSCLHPMRSRMRRAFTP